MFRSPKQTSGKIHKNLPVWLLRCALKNRKKKVKFNVALILLLPPFLEVLPSQKYSSLLNSVTVFYKSWNSCTLSSGKNLCEKSVNRTVGRKKKKERKRKKENHQVEKLSKNKIQKDNKYCVEITGKHINIFSASVFQN